MNLLWSRRRLVAALFAAGSVWIALLIALTALGVLDPQVALLIAAVSVVAAGVLGNALLLVRLTRRLDRLRRRVDGRARAEADALAAARRDLLAAIARTHEDVTQVRAETLEVLKSAEEGKNELQRLRSRTLPRLSREVAVRGRHDYEQQVAWSELRDYLDPAPFMPPLRGWAASPDVLRTLVRAIDRHRPHLVVECGSGASSVWLGYALRRAGGGRLVALEHDGRYAALSRRLVAEHGLDDLVEVRHAPLIDWTPAEHHGPSPDTAPRPWYDVSAVADLHDIGLVFVDGPPAATGPQARYPALPVLLPRCTAEAVVVLDDADREDEQAICAWWREEFPEVDDHEEPAEKGARVFVRRPA